MTIGVARAATWAPPTRRTEQTLVRSAISAARGRAAHSPVASTAEVVNVSSSEELSAARGGS